MADDALSMSNTIPEMKGIVDLYDYFARIYSVTYCTKKTIVNRFGSKEDKEELEQSDLKVGGLTPNYDRDSVHLGLWLSEDLPGVTELNVTHRIKKTDNKLFGGMRSVIWDDSGHVSLETKLNLYKTLLRPSLLSGLNALCVEGKQLARLIHWEQWLLREIYRVKDNASVYGLYANSHLMPIEGHLHKAVLGLFYNAWTNLSNPVVDVIKETMSERECDGFWAVHLKKICTKYRIPSPMELLKEPAPMKHAWKDYVNDKINTYYKVRIQMKIETMKTLEFMNKDVSFDGKLEKCLASSYGGSAKTIKAVNSLLISEYPTEEWKLRNNKAVSDNCPNCRKEKEDVQHLLINCGSINNDDTVKARRRRVENCWKELGMETADKNQQTVSLYRICLRFHGCISTELQSKECTQTDSVQDSTRQYKKGNTI